MGRLIRARIFCKGNFFLNKRQFWVAISYLLPSENSRKLPRITPLFFEIFPLFFSDFAPKRGHFLSLFMLKTLPEGEVSTSGSLPLFAIFHLKTALFLPDFAGEVNARFLPILRSVPLVWPPPPNSRRKPIKAQKEHKLVVYDTSMLNNCKVLKNTLINPRV